MVGEVGGVGEGEALAALQAEGWDVTAAVRRLKLDRLLRSAPLATSSNFNLKMTLNTRVTKGYW